jgi:uncharacterized membrane protein
MTKENTDLLIIMLVGIFLIVFGNYKRVEYKKLIAVGIKTEGTIMSIEQSWDNENTSYYYPTVSFQTNKNETVIKQYSIATSQPVYKVGDSVVIYYDGDDSKTFIIDDKRTKFLASVFLIGGCVMVIICVIQYFFGLIPFQ